MLVIRPVRTQDIDALQEFAREARAGLTNLPTERHLLDAKVEQSKSSFDRLVEAPSDELYSFVLEDTERQRTIGTCGIFATTGCSFPQYRYRIALHRRESQTLHSKWTERVLLPVKHTHGPSEICSLFLDSNYRRGGIGRLLSFSRFLFMRSFPERFQSEVIAEMRGVSYNCEECPFWAAVGKHFTTLEFCEALKYFVHEQRFIREFLPEHPIYISLLPREAQDVIGRVHPETQPALKLLESEGFRFKREVDIFDAGPTIQADISNIRSVKESSRAKIVSIQDAEPESGKQIISNTRIDFRAVFGQVDASKGPGEVVLSRATAEALECDVGDEIQFVSPWMAVKQEAVS